MHDSTLGRWLIAALMLLTPWVVNAAGLGKLTVLSALGQPFQAEIDLMSVQKEDLGTLSARLASPDAYRKAGLQYNSAVVGLALRIEKRPNGQPFIKVTSTRPVNEFVVDLLIDLSWASGRLMREYRVLLDPPGAEMAPPVAASRPAPVAAPTPRPVPVQSTARPAAAPGSYGPIQRGETLSKIASGVRPDGVSVEQMLVSLFRSNPDAFIHKNMNLVRSGKILRVPDKEEVAAIPQEEAVKEYRAQVADWNSYRQKLAAAAAPAPEGGAATSGRITARVDDKAAAAETRDVVRLSKGEPPGATPGAKDGQQASAKDRIRTLEEEIISRDKALKEANERVAQLEKSIKDMQRLMEIKNAGMAAAQQKAEVAAKPEASATPPAQPAEAKAPATPAKSEAPKAKPKPAKAAPPLPPEPSLLETLFDPLYLGGIGVILLGGLGFWLMRRRRAEDAGGARALLSPTFGGPGMTPTLAPAAAAVGAEATAAAPAPVEPAADVDPLEEARIYIAHGRDTQAEAILKEALAREPKREIIHLKLLEIYAARKDKAAFGRYAGEFQKLTGGHGESWLKVAAMGFALDAANPMYAAGKDALGTAPGAEETRSVDMDLDLDLTPASAGAPEGALDMDSGKVTSAAEAKPVAPVMPDFNLEVPPVAHTESVAASHVATATPVADAPPLDFNLELPKIEVPGTASAAAAASPQHRTGTEPGFKLADIDLSLDDKPQGAANGSGGKDAHWYDVQTKFDLAKAYEEMGDRAGAKEILQEVIREGDADQQAQAKALLADLG